MSDITKQDLVDALRATQQDLTTLFRTELGSTKQDLTDAIKDSEQMIIHEVGLQLESIADNMVTKGDLKASEHRQSMRLERALTKHVVTWHAQQLR